MFHSRTSRGFTLIETAIVLGLLALSLVVALPSLSTGLSRLEARGAAQVWQAAGAWAQVSALWSGDTVAVEALERDLTVSRLGGPTSRLQDLAPAVPLSTNLSRWRRPGGVIVRFSGVSAAPDGGGSLYFKAVTGAYRVVVRPESGLTVRSLSESAP